jgi:predicted transposase/invertase (TIGR01784 family)
MRKKTTPVPKGKFAQLTLDFPFKKTFASEGDEDILIALLNVFLERKLAHPITQVVIQNPYIQGQTKANRDAHLDIRCRDSEGNRFIVEMQTGRQKHFFKRAVYYSSMAISGGGKKGEGWDFNFPNVYSLNFLDYDIDFGEGNDNIVQYFSFSDDEYPEIKQNCMNLVFVKLAKFKKNLKECESLQDKLVFSLCHAHEMDCKPEQFVEKLFDRLFEIARISNFTSEEVSEYEASLMTRWDYSASMKFAKEEGFALGEARGVARGEARGVAIGEAIGETKGVLRTARQMRAKGFNSAVIAEITGLSEAEIRELD